MFFSLEEKTKNETETPRNAPKKSRVVAALLDVRTGEGGALRDSAVLTNEGTPSCSAFDGELFVVATSLGFLVAWNLHTGDAPMTNAHAREKKNARAAVAAVALVPGDGDAPARVLSGGADRALMLWGQGAPAARAARAGVARDVPGRAGAEAGGRGHAGRFAAEVVALGPPEDAEPDAALAEAGKKNANASESSSSSSNVLQKYALRHDPGSAASSYASFDAFTRRVPVWEGAYVAGGETGGSGTREGNEKKNASGFSAARALAGSGRSAEEEAARQKREEDEARAKQRAMDGAGVARNPDVRATADGARTCSNPTCVAREDAMAPGRKMLRCSRCKRATIVTHCQRTHWRDGHKRALSRRARRASAANEAPAAERGGAEGRATGAATGCPRGAKRLSRPRPVPPGAGAGAAHAGGGVRVGRVRRVRRVGFGGGGGCRRARPRRRREGSGRDGRPRGLILGAERDGRRLGRRGAGASAVDDRARAARRRKRRSGTATRRDGGASRGASDGRGAWIVRGESRDTRGWLGGERAGAPGRARPPVRAGLTGAWLLRERFFMNFFHFL